MSPALLYGELKDFIDIEDLPKKYGGNLDWAYGDGPKPDLELKELLFKGQTVEDEAEALRGPMKWIVDEGRKGHAIQLGKIGGKARGVPLAAATKMDQEPIHSFSQ